MLIHMTMHHNRYCERSNLDWGLRSDSVWCCKSDLCRFSGRMISQVTILMTSRHPQIFISYLFSALLYFFYMVCRGTVKFIGCDECTMSQRILSYFFFFMTSFDRRIICVVKSWPKYREEKVFSRTRKRVISLIPHNAWMFNGSFTYVIIGER
jgi:hypothetical protein